MKGLFRRGHETKNSPDAFVEAARELDEAGLWEEFPHDQREAKRTHVAAGGWPLDGGEEGRHWWFADGEDLAEGGVEEWLISMAPALKAEGVSLAIETVRNDPAGYVIRVNGVDVEIFGQEGFTARAWEDATVRPLAEINRLLGRAHSADRVGVFYAGGNEGIAHLLPIPVWDVLRRIPAWGPKNLPTVP